MRKISFILICITSYLTNILMISGDDSKDLFSSTDDMKKLFSKEVKISGNNNLVFNLNILKKLDASYSC